MINTFQIRLSALQEHFRQDSNALRYKDELKYLRRDIGRSCDEDDADMLHLFKTVSRELGFITG